MTSKKYGRMLRSTGVVLLCMMAGCCATFVVVDEPPCPDGNTECVPSQDPKTTGTAEGHETEIFVRLSAVGYGDGQEVEPGALKADTAKLETGGDDDDDDDGDDDDDDDEEEEEDEDEDDDDDDSMNKKTGKKRVSTKPDGTVIVRKQRPSTRKKWKRERNGKTVEIQRIRKKRKSVKTKKKRGPNQAPTNSTTTEEGHFEGDPRLKKRGIGNSKKWVKTKREKRTNVAKGGKQTVTTNSKVKTIVKKTKLDDDDEHDTPSPSQVPTEGTPTAKNRMTEPPTRSPIVESEFCSCSPRKFTFRLDFARTCDTSQLHVGPETGVNTLACDVGGTGKDAPLDVKPVRVTSYKVLELAVPDLRILQQFVRRDVALVSGDTIEYTSITASTANTVTPGGLQVIIDAVNFEGQTLVSSWIVDYTNLCGTLVFEAGDSIGWTVFEELQPPRPSRCNAPENDEGRFLQPKYFRG